jgi:hypothetical protein
VLPRFAGGSRLFWGPEGFGVRFLGFLLLGGKGGGGVGESVVMGFVVGFVFELHGADL